MHGSSSQGKDRCGANSSRNRAIRTSTIRDGMGRCSNTIQNNEHRSRRVKHHQSHISQNYPIVDLILLDSIYSLIIQKNSEEHPYPFFKYHNYLGKTVRKSKRKKEIVNKDIESGWNDFAGKSEKFVWSCR